VRHWSHPSLTVALFAGLAIVNTYPLAFAPRTTIGHHGDALFSVWRLAWVAHQLAADPARLWDANIFYPEPTTLAYSDAMLLPAIVLAPAAWLGADPLALYNLTLVGTFVLNAVAAFVLVRRLTGSIPAGQLAGVIFAFSPYRFEHFDHLELQFAFWIPVAVLAWHHALERGRARDYLAVSALAAGQVLSCIYYGVFLLTWLGAVTALWFVRTPGKALRALGLILGPALVVLATYSLPYLGNRTHLGDRPEAEVRTYSARPADFASAPATNRLYGWTATIGAGERRLFPGVVAAVLLVVGLWPPWSRVRLIHAAGLLVALELARGSNGLLYPVLYEWVLPYRGLRVPARATILILLGTGVLAGFGMVRAQAWARARGVSAALVIGILLLASAETLTTPVVTAVNTRISPWYGWLSTQPDAVVFEWPVTVPWRIWYMVDVRYMYRSTRHWRPLLNGYSGYYPRSYMEMLYTVRSFPDSRSIAYLQRRGATVLAIHDEPHSRPSFAYAIERLARDPDVALIATDRDGDGRVVFFRLKPPRENAPGAPGSAADRR